MPADVLISRLVFLDGGVKSMQRISQRFEKLPDTQDAHAREMMSRMKERGWRKYGCECDHLYKLGHKA